MKIDERDQYVNCLCLEMFFEIFIMLKYICNEYICKYVNVWAKVVGLIGSINRRGYIYEIIDVHYITISDILPSITSGEST